VSSPTWPVPPTATASGGGTPHWPVATEPYDTGMPLEPLAVQEEAAAENGPTYWVSGPGGGDSFVPRSPQIRRLSRILTGAVVASFLVAFGAMAWNFLHGGFGLAILLIIVPIVLIFADILFMMTVGRRLDERYVKQAQGAGAPPAPAPLRHSPAAARLDRVVSLVVIAVCVGSGIVAWSIWRSGRDFTTLFRPLVILVLVVLGSVFLSLIISAIVGHHLDRRYAEQSPGGDGTPPLFIQGGTR